MPVNVFLADLRHDYSGVLGSECMPLGIAYMKAVMDRDGGPGIKSRLFVYPTRLLAALKETPPDILMLTNYAWNEGLMRFFLSAAKAINPDLLTVAGGPNIPVEPHRQESYVRALPDLDLYVLGEGDFRALNIVERFMEAGLSRNRLLAGPIASCTVRTSDGDILVSPTEPRHKQLQDIPSPWLTGIQDEFFDGKLSPMIETNRGCPFTCTFCVQGTNFYTKVNYFPIDRLKEELCYIAQKIRQYSPAMGTLRIADSNYGMFERDIEISGFIGQLQRDYRWPIYIDATTGKNRADRVIKSVEKVSGALVVYQAVQSLDEDVLQKIKRENIKLSAYNELAVYMRGRGLKSVSDLILGLPGETLAGHLKALRRLIDSDMDQLHNMQAMVLKGSELETLESREQFKFDTRFRLVPKSFGEYGNVRVFDTEEIVVATDTLTFDDYLTARKWHLISSIFWNNGWFSDVVRFVRAFGIANSEWWSRMLPAMENGSPRVRALMQDFVRDTIGQLFPSREACENFYRQDENFEKLRHGLLGDNLMYRYRAISSFCIWNEICETAMNATRELLVEAGAPQIMPEFDQFFDEFHEYIRLTHATGIEKDAILARALADLSYDFPAWLRSDDLKDPSPYRYTMRRRFEFALAEKHHHELDCALRVWTTAIPGLAKLVTRVSTQSQTRVCRLAE